ncbi:MAG: AraC family transcriptional regulator [Eubacteriales bacterium]|nr:AraC family transcriptional regulator [Eubacteriales bacterium]
MAEQSAYCSTFNPDASENVAYNNPLFPLYVRYGILSAYPNYSAISHWHDDLEFILIKKGRMTYNVNGTLIDLAEHTGILVNSRQLHYGFSAEHQECEFLCILFSPEIFHGNPWFYEHLIEPITENTACPCLYLSGHGWQKTILEHLDALYRFFQEAPDQPPAQPDAYFDLFGCLTAILKILYQNLPAQQPASAAESQELAALKAMISYIEEHFSGHLTLQDIANAGACCKSKCSLLFRKYLRDTPISYLTKLRLRNSITALLGSDACITDIALEYGFGGASYYCETFRKYYGISPLQYKKKFAQDSPM